MRRLIGLVAAAVALAGCAASEQRTVPAFDPYTDWEIHIIHIAKCLPLSEGGILDACCENYLAAKNLDEESAVRPYDDYARFDVGSAIQRNAYLEQPIPDISDPQILRRRIFSYIESYCVARPKSGFIRAVHEAWSSLPKPVETAGMSIDEGRDLIAKMDQFIAQEDY